MILKYGKNRGFTLMEILIALAVFSILIAGLVKTFSAQQTTLTKVGQRSRMMINVRGAIYMIEAQIRLMGFSPKGELDADDTLNPDAGCCARPGYLVFQKKNPDDLSEIKTVGIGLKNADDDQDGGRDGLADEDAGATGLIVGGQLAADNIEAIRFAYAFDEDDDGCLDLSDNDQIIWAYDGDADGELDTYLDTNDDGRLDTFDILGGKDLDTPVDIDAIRAVKVWLLVRSANPLRGGRLDTRMFYLGGQAYSPEDRYGHTRCTTTIRCRNMSS